MTGPLNLCDTFLHAVEVRSFYRHQIPPLANSDANKSHHLPHLSIRAKNTEFKIVTLNQIMRSDTILQICLNVSNDLFHVFHMTYLYSP